MDFKLKLKEYTRWIFFSLHRLNLRYHGKQHGWCEARQMNPMSDQRWASPDPGRENPTGQLQGSNGSIRKLLLLIYKVGVDEVKYSHQNITMTLKQTICLNCITLCVDKQEARSAEVEALAPVFEKSATELEQKLLKCKNTVHLVTLNVWNWNRIGQIPELIVSAA